jgi:hypothetical protein
LEFNGKHKLLVYPEDPQILLLSVMEPEELCLLLAGYSLGLFFDTEEGGSVFPQKVDGHLPDYTTSHYREYCSLNNWKLENIL